MHDKTLMPLDESIETEIIIPCIEYIFSKRDMYPILTIYQHTLTIFTARKLVSQPFLEKDLPTTAR